MSSYENLTLHHSAYIGDHETLAKLLEGGLDPNIIDGYGNTPLHKAATNGHLECISLLLKFDANSNVCSNKGYTPLHFVIIEGRYHCITILLEHGADKDFEGIIRSPYEMSDRKARQIINEYFSSQ